MTEWLWAFLLQVAEGFYKADTVLTTTLLHVVDKESTDGFLLAKAFTLDQHSFSTARAFTLGSETSFPPAMAFTLDQRSFSTAKAFTLG